MDKYADIITAVAAFFALFISIYSAAISRNEVVSSSISSSRIDWIKEVRKLLYEFLSEYRHQNRKDVMIDLYTHIVLFFNHRGDTYKNLIESMKKCINNGYSDENYWNVVTFGQHALDLSWRRMKREAGVSFKREKYNSNMYRKEEKEKSKSITWNADIKK